MTLPISLDDLSPKVRDWLLAKASFLQVSPMQVLADALEVVAKRELKNKPEGKAA